MNVSEMKSSTVTPTHANTSVSGGSDLGPLTLLPTHADTTVIDVVTAGPIHTDSTIIAVVVILILLTVAALGFLLYRYLCHNKGEYRTTGEPAPGEEPGEDYNDQASNEKKEYFI